MILKTLTLCFVAFMYSVTYKIYCCTMCFELGLLTSYVHEFVLHLLFIKCIVYM